ncbi:MAG: hypothetical protein KJ607_11580, partial [Bacteroidetes bacterium]|nr:hypothetical protein [Bacteroidota bacterium]
EDTPEKELVVDDKAQLVAEMEYLISQEKKLKEKQFNAISNFEMLNKEAKATNEKVTLLHECNTKVRTNTESMEVIAEKASLVKPGLRIDMEARLEMLHIPAIIEPEEVVMAESRLEYLADNTSKTIRVISNTLEYKPDENNENIAYNMNESDDYNANEQTKVNQVKVTDDTVGVEKATTDTQAVVDLYADQNVGTSQEDTIIESSSEKDDEILKAIDESGKEESETTEVAGKPKMIEVKGIITLLDNNTLDNSFKVNYIDMKDISKVGTVKPDIKTGAYSLFIEPGSYKLEFEGTGYRMNTEIIDIPPIYARSDLVVNTEMTPAEVASGEYYITKAIFFDFAGDNLTRESKIELEKLFRLMNENPSLYFEVVGYTDSRKPGI